MSQADLFKNVHSNVIHNSPKVETNGRIFRQLSPAMKRNELTISAETVFLKICSAEEARHTFMTPSI